MRINDQQEKIASEGNALLNPDQVAKYLGIKRCTVYRLAREKKIPSIKFAGNLRFDRKKLDEFLREHENKPGMHNA